ncbi:PREDICTED: RNA-binding protein 48 [Chinchilla lanigera]|uniref:RNA-binding protein 48 n=1 Tax=Chinchilla lanigera TaxID=34839 RepID=A0A8C2UZ87_CHILA|nr:PREDICTED: RNA-binding protein 48 [Chinchilla lanigera]XP_005388078.1 PREDICTED: RNA-binding protein 48 [Chinchilla lanigera]XP_013371392.1 PREDICTED: RNA-binding protein 48 [Chinchilla lanigera]XP_013371393.1 PREDICTED: RNA-binding protein 48 [Chinchilla lanigera]
MASSDGQFGNVLDHHVRRAVCATRAKYREGRRPRAVKVYTINLESRYLLIQGVPAVGAMKQLVERFALYGTIEEYNALDEYPAEDFTEVYLIKFMSLQSARIAKRKMDEQSFFGGLLHVCYAPEFETIEETRKKLEERKAYIARATKNEDYYMTKKKPVPEHKDTEDFRQAFHSEMPGFCAVTLNTPTGSQDPLFPYSCELPLGYFASKYVCSPGEHVDRTSDSYKDGRDYNETVKHCIYSDSSPKLQMNTSKNLVPHSGAQKAITPSGAVDRFMPRTTQLQERKRRREDDHKLGTFETSTGSNEVMIGPKLPDIPKIDLQDDSLNTTANLIRKKLKEVISSVPKPPEDKLEAVCTSHPLKQRRRI